MFEDVLFINKFIFVFFKLQYFNDILPEISKVTENEVIIISVSSFFDELGPLLERTSKR